MIFLDYRNRKYIVMYKQITKNDWEYMNYYGMILAIKNWRLNILISEIYLKFIGFCKSIFR